MMMVKLQNIFFLALLWQWISCGWCLDVSSSVLTGKHRRILRGLCIQYKQQNLLPVLSVNIAKLQTTDDQVSPISGVFPQAVLDRIQSSLLQDCELCNVKFTGNIKKKKDAKKLGENIVELLNSKSSKVEAATGQYELVQTLGHGILLYKRPPSDKVNLHVGKMTDNDKKLIGKITKELEEEYLKRTLAGGVENNGEDEEEEDE